MYAFFFYVLIKGLRRAWLFEVSESPSRGYWKQFLLSHPFEHSQNLHAAEGDILPRGKLPPPPRPPLKPHVCFHFYVIIKGLRRAWLSEVLKAFQEDTGNNFSYLVSMNKVRIYLQSSGTLYPGVNCTPSPTPINSHVCVPLSPGYSIPPNSPELRGTS